LIPEREHVARPTRLAARKRAPWLPSLNVDTGSVIAVVASSVVALAAIGAAFWQQKRGFVYERKLSDLESVRGVMSEAAAVLHRVEYALDEANSTLIQWGARFFEDEERARPYDLLEEVGREVDGVLGQLRIRFGPEHPAAVAFGDAGAAMLDVFRALGLIKLEDPAIKGTYDEREVVGMVAQQRDRISTGRENFGIAQEQFVSAAHSAAGAKLPAD
jgi:hypothetical protein